MLTIGEQDESEIRCAFSGNLGVLESLSVYNEIKNLDLSYQNFHIIVKDVENLNLSFFQLLYVFIQKLISLDKKVSFEFLLDDEYQRIFLRSGLQRAFDKLVMI